MPDDHASIQKTTALHGAHLKAGARMCPFAGYEMPLQYEGVLAEHRWTREHAGLFDVSHMGPAILSLNAPSGDQEADHQAICALLEPLVCADLVGLPRGKVRYTLLLNEGGGILDDLFVGRPDMDRAQGSLVLIVNGATKDADYAHIMAAVGDRTTLRRVDESRSLLALQGPEAAAVLEPVFPGVSTRLTFMTFGVFEYGGRPMTVFRSGYTGEDGFEVIVDNDLAESLWDRLLSDDRVKPVGLAARDSLRLEAGLPLYGHDMDETVSPIEAGMGFALSKRRREAGDFPGAGRILAERDGALKRIRVGLKVEGAPAREGAEIADEDGAVIGRVTSGGFSPSLSAPIAIGFVPPSHSAVGGKLKVIVRGKAQAAEVTALPFVPHRYVHKL